MNTLENVYCLGCKTRHDTVIISEINTITVRGSTRHQAKGKCPEGKTWTKILKASEIPTMESTSEEKVEEEDVKDEPILETPLSEGDEEAKVSTVDVFERAKREAEVVEEPVSEAVTEVIPVEEKVPVSVETVEEVIQIEQPRIQIEEEDGDGEEEDGGEIHILHTKYPRPHKKVQPPSPRIRPPKKETPIPTSEGENEKRKRAYGIGFEIGGRVAEEEGIEFGEFIEECWYDTRIPQQYSEDFVQGYLAGGMQVIEVSMSSASVEEEPTKNLKPTTVAGIAGLGIFGAWLASKLNQGQR